VLVLVLGWQDQVDPTHDPDYEHDYEHEHRFAEHERVQKEYR